MRRREFLIVSAAGIGGWALTQAQEQRPQAENANPSLRIPLRFFTREEALIVAAAASRIFPADESGPGAHEAGVVFYIDRQLAGPWGRGARLYQGGPFEGNAPAEFGYQGKATPRQIYREALKGLRGFDKLSPARQDRRLHQIEHTLFFAMLRRNTIEGMFSDPLHGGNMNMTGWQLIGFPGPRMSNYADVDKHFGETYRPKPVSLREVIEVEAHPSEDER